MIARLWTRCAAVVSVTALTTAPRADAQSAARPAGGPPSVDAAPRRAIRRDLPLTNMIRHAFAVGTRDSSGRPGPRYAQVRTTYAIDARLDIATSTVTGRERVVVYNGNDSSMRVLVLRLDQNLYRPNVPRAEVVPELTDGMVITRLAVNGQPVDVGEHASSAGGTTGGPPTPRTGPVAVGLTQTVATVRLPTPVPARGTVVLDAEWHFRVPRVEAPARGLRMGRWADTLYQVAQWYPRVAVYDDLRGWDTDPYLGPSEFYNNYGHFDVHLDLPAGWLVGSTGALQNPEEVLTPTARARLALATTSDSQRTIVGVGERGPGRATAAGDRLIWHFTADSVADVAWAASDRFVWDATRASIPGRGPVPVHLFYLPGHAAGFANGGAVVRHALEYYSRLWIPYAYPQLTMVDGPEGGMEYPMFLMSSAYAADHEAGHQWWPMMVGVNETWYAWMDEGFNQYMNVLSQADRERRAPRLDSLGQAYGRVSGNEREAPLMWDANYGGPMYGFQAYGKAPMMLSMLGGIVGDSAVQRAMRGYAETWQFKHPSPWDFAFYMERALGRDLGWFWYYWLFTTESVDGSITRVTTAGRPARPRTTVTVRQDGQMPAPVVLEVKFAPTGPPVRLPPAAAGYTARMADSVTLVATWPVDVWFDGRRTFEAVLDVGGRRIARVTLDPGARFPDRDPRDNVWPRAAVAPTAGRAAGGH